MPKWLTNRVHQIDLNASSPARSLQYLHDTNSLRSRALLQKFDAVADALGLDDTLLDLCSPIWDWNRSAYSAVLTASALSAGRDR